MNIIKILRLSKGLSLRQLANKSGLSHQTIKNIEDDINSPTIGSLKKIFKALDKEDLLRQGVIYAENE